MRKEMQTALIIWGLAILLVAALVYIGWGKYQQNKQEKELVIYQNGVRYGFEQAIIQIMQQGLSCQQVPLSARNTTMNFIAVQCLQQNKEEKPNVLG